MLLSRGLLIAACILALIPSLALSATFDAQKVSSLRAEILQDINVNTEGNIEDVSIDVMIPQEDSFQSIESMDVSRPYTYKNDKFGNRMINVAVRNPTGNVINFQVKSVVSVKRRNSASIPQNKEFLQSTDLIQSKDPEISSLAESVTAEKPVGFDQITAVDEWVNKNIKYDLAYADVNLSAKRTLELKAGVCDEFSTLAISMHRSLGYPAAYIVGYAYGRGYRQAEDFVPHGWTEVCSPDGKCYPSDPTWAEVGWLDATHIKFATLADSYYVEASAIAKGTGNLNVKIDSVKTTIKILEKNEQPAIITQSQIIDDTLWSGQAVVKTNLKTDGCISTKIYRNSCVFDGKPFFEPEINESIESFCGEKTLYSIFKTPSTLDNNMRYTCTLSVGVGGGTTTETVVSLDPLFKESVTPKVSLDKTSLKESEEFIAISPGAYLFTDFGASGDNSLVSNAPSYNFKVFAYKNGQLAEQEVSVVKEIPLEATILVNETVIAGVPYQINLSVENIVDSDKFVSITFENQTASTSIPAGAQKVFTFNFTAGSADDNVVRAFISTDGFSTSVSKSVTVIEPPNKKDFISDLIEAIISFFKKLLGRK